MINDENMSVASSLAGVQEAFGAEDMILFQNRIPLLHKLVTIYFLKPFVTCRRLLPGLILAVVGNVRSGLGSNLGFPFPNG